MSLVPHGSSHKRKARRIESTDRIQTVERLIERDFFPDLHQRRSISHTVDLTSDVESPVDLDSETLDSFNDKFISAQAEDLQKSIALDNTRRMKPQATLGTDLSVLMFNHPGLPSRASRRSRINFENTRFPAVQVPVHAPKRRSNEQGTHRVETGRETLPVRSTLPVTEDILSRTLRRSHHSANT